MVPGVPSLPITPDELLFTTRAVRKRLDLTREVPDELILDCVAAALQAPSGSNNITMRFVVVRDPAKRRALGELYASAWELYTTLPQFVGAVDQGSAEGNAQQARVRSSAEYLAEHLGEVPALVIACNEGTRSDGLPGVASAAMMANILPATWSFMLAARARLLGTAWTTIHLMKEREAAELLGIPFDTVQQCCLTPLAYTIGTEFKPAKRPAPDTVIHWDGW